jgi:predicted 3-demethylubiquinone-9 3-methyltransferase (glyoxalase superfamily)
MAISAKQRTSDGARRSRGKQKITPHLWFDDQAQEAVEFYTSLFPDSKVGPTTRYSREGFEVHGQPEGKVMTVEFELAGLKFIALNGGPHFQFTPAVSFFVICDSAGEVDELWQWLSAGGTALMELDRYDWSERYGWIQDRFGLSWQLMLDKVEDIGQKMVPCLLFVGDRPQAEDAIKLYTSVFEDSQVLTVSRHDDQGPLAGMAQYARFRLDGEVFVAMDGGPQHAIGLNEAISFLIACDSQAEIDRFWNELGAGGDPKAQQCGWLKDRFGVSWQVSPTILHEMLLDPDQEGVKRVTRAFLAMKKFDIAELQAAYRG